MISLEESASKSSFDATFSWVERQDAWIRVGFADDEYDVRKYLLLERERHLTIQDSKLGFGELHIEIDDQSKSAYGQIRRCVLREDRVLLWFEAETALALKVSEVAIRFALQRLQLDEIERGLALLFEDNPTVFESEI